MEEAYDVESSEEEELREDDVIGKALQKCAKISALLRKELYGSSGASCERYAELVASSMGIVPQNDIDGWRFWIFSQFSNHINWLA